MYNRSRFFVSSLIVFVLAYNVSIHAGKRKLEDHDAKHNFSPGEKFASKTKKQCKENDNKIKELEAQLAEKKRELSKRYYNAWLKKLKKYNEKN